MHCHVWDAVLEAYRKLKAKTKTIADSASGYLGNMPQGLIDKVVKEF